MSARELMRCLGAIGALSLAACAHGPPVDKSYRAVRADELPERVAGDMPQLSDAIKRRHAGDLVDTRYLIYVDSDGAVRRVDALDGLADADPEILRALGTWRYPPRSDRARTEVRFKLSFQWRSADEIKAALADPPGPKPRLMRGEEFKALLIDQEEVIFPRNLVLKYSTKSLYGVAKVCADGATGKVNHVRYVDGVPEAESAIVEPLRHWRIRPPSDGVPICSVMIVYFGGGSYWVPDR